MLSVMKKLVLEFHPGATVNSGYVHRKGVATENVIFKLTNKILNNK